MRILNAFKSLGTGATDSEKKDDDNNEEEEEKSDWITHYVIKFNKLILTQLFFISPN